MVGSAPESSRQVSNGAASAIAARLSRAPDLKLPGQLTRDGPVSEEKKTDYLNKLILHDPGVFLERHGDVLEAEECAAFHQLRSSSYEIDFHLKTLEDRRNNPPQNKEMLSTQVKNRRLAAMRNLIREGEHFSEEAMRHRQPYLYHLHVGQYTCTILDTSQEGEENEESGDVEGGSRVSVEGASVPLEATTLARSLMRQQEEVDLMVRREEERERYDMIEREQEEEESEEEEQSEEENEELEMEKDNKEKNKDTKGKGGEAEGVASGGEIVPAAAEENAEPRDDRNPSWWGGPSGEERITPEERETNLEIFRDIMQQKFLAGEDTGTNYVAIDTNQEFDLSEEAVRDAEEAYFDTD